MRVKRGGALLLSIVASLLAWPATSLADHVSVSGSVAAHVERFGTDSWLVEISFSAYCQGAGSKGASFYGDLSMVDLDTAESVYLGGVSSASGTSTQIFHSIDRWRRFSPMLRVGCSDDATLHGSDFVEVAGGSVLIPPRLGGRGGGGGGSRGGGSGGTVGDPTEPLRTGGCLALVVGSEVADTLAGGSGGEVILALAGADAVRGGGGHDCLVGGSGRDTMRGEAGSDRLVGGPGGDRLLGGDGSNAYDAGPGRDFVDALNGKKEVVLCGPGRDRVRADPNDVLSGCELLGSAR